MAAPPDGECTLPTPVPPETLRSLRVKHPVDDGIAIRDYVESQARDETVTYVELILIERLGEREYECWDVHTDKDRWWVITQPINLYRHSDFPSIDFLLSFHIGLTTRVMLRREPPITDEQEQRLAAAWRRWSQAAEAHDRADEAEDFQSVGMRCRECLLEFVRAAARTVGVDDGNDLPKRADFEGWAGIIANTVAYGASAEDVRRYLKGVAKAAWPLVNWLTHATGATRMDGELALKATETVLASFGLALVRYERGAPDRCTICDSYKLTSLYRPKLDIDPPYITKCESCGWMSSSE